MSNVIRLERVGARVVRVEECGGPGLGIGAACGGSAAVVRPRVSAVPVGAERPMGVGHGALMAQAGSGTRVGAGLGARGVGFVRGGACGKAVARPSGLAEGEVVDAAWVTARLEEAGRTLLALPGSGYTTKLRTSSLDIVRTAMEAFGGEVGRARPPVPSAAHITRMDEALGWIPLIPQDRYVLRRIVGARCLVSPVTERALYSWRKLGGLLGADHKAVQRWHAQGIALLVTLLGG